MFYYFDLKITKTWFRKEKISHALYFDFQKSTGALDFMCTFVGSEPKSFFSRSKLCINQLRACTDLFPIGWISGGNKRVPSTHLQQVPALGLMVGKLRSSLRHVGSLQEMVFCGLSTGRGKEVKKRTCSNCCCGPLTSKEKYGEIRSKKAGHVWEIITSPAYHSAVLHTLPIWYTLGVAEEWMRCLPISRQGTNHSLWLLVPESLGEFLLRSANQNTWGDLGWVLNLGGKTSSLLNVLEALPLALVETGFIFGSEFYYKRICLHEQISITLELALSAEVGGLNHLYGSFPSHIMFPENQSAFPMY